MQKRLLAGAALSVLACAGQGLAQEAAPTADLLGEVVVTATRQSDTVSRVPLSITAVTGAALDQRQIRSVQDLTRSVPSVQFRKIGQDNQTTIAIRGIASNFGAPTTGVYIDDTPISKRAFAGTAQANGNPYPSLFDMQRVEVLRGPQGTLFGAGSQGGTVRFITAEPSVTRSSGAARAGVSKTEGGEFSYDTGLALGGPIIEDKLGFRAAAQLSYVGGYLDHVSHYDGHEFGKNTNDETHRSFKGALLWRPVENLRITPSLYMGYDRLDDTDSFIENIPQFTLNSGYFLNRGVSRNGVAWSLPTTYYQGGTYGPYNMFGPTKTNTGLYLDEQGAVNLLTSPNENRTILPTLKVEFDRGGVTVTSITSLLEDHQKGVLSGVIRGIIGAALPIATYNSAQGGCFSSRPDICAPVPNGIRGPGMDRAPFFYPGFPGLFYNYHYRGPRNQFTQEIRIASSPDARPLRWVIGAFYMNSRQNIRNYQHYNEPEMSVAFRGFNVFPYQYGVTDFVSGGQGMCYDVPVRVCYGTDPNVVNNGNQYSASFKRSYESEIAAFGEASYYITDDLYVTAGVRASKLTTDFYQITRGTLTTSANALAQGFRGTPAHPYPILPGDPDIAAVLEGVQKESPINPKIGVTYQVTPTHMVYATAAKGYRAGGVNGLFDLSARPDCQAQLQAFGLSTVPTTYDSDVVWSYEAGTKLRLFGARAQVNASLFRIDWKDPQLSVRVPCGTTFIANAGQARSEGLELETQFRLFQGFSLTVGGTYNKAEYTVDTVAVDPNTGVRSYTVHKGDKLPTPELQYMIGARYEREVFGGWLGYIQGDYQFTGPYKRTAGPGGLGYDPLVYDAAKTEFAAASLGVNKDGLDVQLFVKNLTGSEDRVSVYRSNVNTTTANTFQPREIGLQVVKRF